MSDGGTWCYCTDSGDGAVVLCEPHQEMVRLKNELDRTRKELNEWKRMAQAMQRRREERRRA